MLLPSNDVLQPRNYDTTLMSCLLSDPSFKVRIAAASTIMAMLDGPASISLQVAEFKEHSKHGPFTTLSSSLGHILMQLHSGTLYLLKHETSNRLLTLSFKIIMLLIASTPNMSLPVPRRPPQFNESYIQECLLSCSLELSLHSSQQLKRGFHIIMIGIACWPRQLFA
ncbi:HEAT repeat-containing protein 6-like isoform X3 [Salvia divinorum]|uniref:HEAT repeat-containing protein 6-like isoform X3 n=1 Tax=Salvia divinorum TaxID=28513 RepID=A0ABD1HRU2_SALDI